jgi:UPF0271 protein
MKVLDAAAFINSALVDAGGCATTREVIEELRSLPARSVADAAIVAGKLRIMQPSQGSVMKVKEKAGEIGSSHKLSPADLSVAALALDTGATIVTDDWTLQNLAAHLGVPFEAVGRGRIREKRTFAGAGKPRNH